MGNRPQVTVLGSLNMDISVTVPRLPEPGATVLGSAARFTPGGKGANQAVAAARLGADVRMAGCVGDDDFGRQLLAALGEEQVDAGGVRTVTGVPTGLAMISVDRAGENLITVAPGRQPRGRRRGGRRGRGQPGDILVICAEIPVPAIRSALAQARRTGPACVAQPGPGPSPRRPPSSPTAWTGWWSTRRKRPPSSAAQVEGLTDAAEGGRPGCWPRAPATPWSPRARTAPPWPRRPGGRPLTIEAFGVEAVDTVGAGDTFVGALAVALAAGVPPAEAVRAAAAAGAAAATRHGAQAGMPRPADILAVDRPDLAGTLRCSPDVHSDVH